MVVAGRAVDPRAATVQGVGEAAVGAPVEGTPHAHTLDVVQPMGPLPGPYLELNTATPAVD